MAPGPLGERSCLQVHPTRRCNLRCAHCYTSSGPDAAGQLPIGMLAGAVADAARLGYGELAVSGGEPLLYGPLDDLLDEARAHGLATVVTTNGLALTAGRARRLAGRVDAVAVSIDGIGATHDAMRGRAGAFETTLRRLAHLADAGIAFGFVFTLTQHNLHELPALLDLAERTGASLVQLHPLDAQGRGALLADQRPDAVEMTVARVAAPDLAGGRVPVQVDALLREELAAHPGRFLGTGLAGGPDLGSWVPVLVVEASGRVVPMSHGFPERFSLGALHDAPLADLARQWQARSAADFAAACAAAHRVLTAPDAPVVTYWYEALAGVIREWEGRAPAVERSPVHLRRAG